MIVAPTHGGGGVWRRGAAPTGRLEEHEGEASWDGGAHAAVARSAQKPAMVAVAIGSGGAS